MRMPKERVRYSRLLDGKSNSEGWILLDLKGLDIEGVNTLAIDVADIDGVRFAGNQQAAASQRVRDLLGG